MTALKAHVGAAVALLISLLGLVLSHNLVTGQAQVILESVFALATAVGTWLGVYTTTNAPKPAG